MPNTDIFFIHVDQFVHKTICYEIVQSAGLVNIKPLSLLQKVKRNM